MHPPRFLQSHLLSDWPECFLEMRCRWCHERRMAVAVKGLMRWHGNKTFAEVLARLRCKFCRRTPASVRLLASKPSGEDSAATGWTLELTLPRRH